MENKRKLDNDEIQKLAHHFAEMLMDCQGEQQKIILNRTGEILIESYQSKIAVLKHEADDLAHEAGFLQDFQERGGIKVGLSV